ncbi:MAG: DEAD/DEAH box helicase, partial [Armatimonadota bacterium]|nr:DEAD/DEAH box helicase [Armatimonadota bacterium]
VKAFCDCPVSDGDPAIVCKHQIASALILRNYLRVHPPQTWETVLAQAVKAEPRRNMPAARQVLLFSLQTRHSAWALYPYSLPLSHFAERTLGDAEALAKTIKQEALSKQAKPIRSQIDPRRFLSASGNDSTVLNLVALTGQGSYSYYFERSFECRALLPLLAGGFVFRGREADPLQTVLRVSAETGQAQIELAQTPEGTALHSFITLGDRKFSLTPEKTAVVSDTPLWLLSGNTLYPVEEGAGLVATLLDNPDLTIPPEDTAAFFDNYLLSLAERVPVTGDGIVWEEERGVEPVPRLYLSEEEGMLAVRLRFGYGAQEVIYEKALPDATLLRKPDSLTLVRLTRRPEREQAWWEAAASGHGLKRGAEPDQFVLRAKTDPVDFLLTQVPRLTEAGFEIYGERALTSARVNRSHPTIAFHVSSGIDWFDVDATVHFGDTEVKLKEVRRAVRRSERYVKLADGSIGEIPAEWLEKYRYLFSMAEDSAEGLRLASAQIGLLDQLLLEGDRIQADDEFQRRRDNLRRFSQIEPRELPSGLTANLHPYQKAGFDWLHFLHEYGFGGCLADDMGLGKTVQCLAFLQSLSESHEAKAATLLVLPRSLVFNWEREAARFTPGLRLLNHAQATRAKDLAVFDEYDLVITTYGIMLRDIEMLRKHRFHYVILDEAQAIKNPVSQSAKAARLLQADHKLTLTGTPVENSTLELWSQFAFLNPGLLGNLEHFRTEFAGAIEKRQDETAAAFLRRLVHPFILRRTKDQVAQDLPPRTERILYTEMEPGQQKLYEKTRDYYRAQIMGIVEKEGVQDARMKILEGLLRLRQISNHPRLVEPDSKAASGKFDTLLETLETLRAEGHKALVFSQFVSMLTLLRESLDAAHIPYAYLDGKTQDRQARVDSFQNDPDLPLFLISLRAGGVGLNLTAADYVIHIDPWWNPAVEAQATDRAHRIGQEKHVFVYKLICTGTVEEKIQAMQQRKADLAKAVLEGGSTQSLRFDEDD